MIRKPIYNDIDVNGKPLWVVPETGKLVYKIQGYDANALYLYCIMQQQLCGELIYNEMGQKCPKPGGPNFNELSKMFGIMIVDIEVPPKNYNYFSEYLPIFVNLNITRSKPEGKPIKKRKLVSVYKAKKILLITPLLHWYLNHGV